MKAITFSTCGDPDVLRLTELPDPQPDPGQVRVRIKTDGVQPVDCAVRSGWFANRSNSFQDEFPVILGNEFAGVIDIAGEEVEQFATAIRCIRPPMHTGTWRQGMDGGKWY